MITNNKNLILEENDVKNLNARVEELKQSFIASLEESKLTDKDYFNTYELSIETISDIFADYLMEKYENSTESEQIDMATAKKLVLPKTLSGKIRPIWFKILSMEFKNLKKFIKLKQNPKKALVKMFRVKFWRNVALFVLFCSLCMISTNLMQRTFAYIEFAFAAFQAIFVISSYNSLYRVKNASFVDLSFKSNEIDNLEDRFSNDSEG